MRVPVLPGTPVDGFVLEWWTYSSCSEYAPGPAQHQMIYIANMSWKEFIADPRYTAFHHYDDSDRAGAKFTDQWIHLNLSEGKLRFVGRSDGWKNTAWDWKDRFATREEALAAFRENTKLYITRQRTNLAHAEELLEGVT